MGVARFTPLWQNVAEEHFYDDLGSEWDLHSVGELVLGIGDFNGHLGKQIEGYEGVHGGNGIGERNVEGKMLLEFCDEKELCVANTWFRKGEKRKVTYSAGENETEIDFVLVGKGNRKYLRDVKVIPGELQHRLVVTDLVKKKVKVVRKEGIERGAIFLCFFFTNLTNFDQILLIYCIYPCIIRTFFPLKQLQKVRCVLYTESFV